MPAPVLTAVLAVGVPTVCVATIAVRSPAVFVELFLRLTAREIILLWHEYERSACKQAPFTQRRFPPVIAFVCAGTTPATPNPCAY